MSTKTKLHKHGICITTKKPTYRGTFYPRIHFMVHEMFGHLLKENEYFQLSSELLLHISVECETPFASDEVILSVLQPFTQELSKVS